MFPLFLHPNQVSVNLLNALLNREPWAKDKVAAHAGKTVRINIARFSFLYTLHYDGSLSVADAAVVPNVSLSLSEDKLSQLPDAIRNRDNPQLLSSLLHLEGDAGLAQLVSDLARDLRWDIKHDLTRMVGPILAKRLLKGFGFVRENARELARRGTENMSEYLSEEARILLSHPAFEGLQEQLREKNQQLDDLQKRIRALQNKRSDRGIS